MAGKRLSKTLKTQATGRALNNNGVPDIYREMLADANSPTSTVTSEEGRAIKRRRVGGRIVTHREEKPTSHLSNQGDEVAYDSESDKAIEDVKPKLQQILQTESEDSADSDIDWQDVQVDEDVDVPKRESDEPGGLDLILASEEHGLQSPNSSNIKRKPITAEERKLRLDIHKMHLCSLMAHLFLRNHWCNDDKVHSRLRSLLTRKTISYLNPPEDQSQFQRSRSFMDGLTQVSEAFRSRFKIAARGISRPIWADSPETLTLMEPPKDIDLPMRLADFREVAVALKASRDVGAHLFCALLRSVGVDTRLVCSLQPLPFQPAQKMTLSRMRRSAPAVPNQASRPSKPHSDSDSDGQINLPATEKDVSSTRRRAYVSPEIKESPETVRSGTSITNVPLRSTKISRKSIRESKYPVYWVEVFNEAMQKWVPVDPLVTRTIAKPSKFEPPAGEPENHMSYVIAFEDDGFARDVTRRYTKAFNAKTRQDRVEVTNGGEQWLRRVMKMYRRPDPLDRDQVEDVELAAKEAAEPMPRNVQDFRDHPYYALERHLKRHEAIHPKREVGKIGVRRAQSSNILESIYRRKDVHAVKSANKWYRLGREIISGEQPLKRVPARRMRTQISDPEASDAALEEDTGTALYAAHQTSLYSAPPVKHGRIPKNMYGNLDIYVPSMVPPGGAHIAHPETARAARVLGIDYADAVTGFTFKGRHGTAVVNGAVVANGFREAIEEVLKAFDDERIAVDRERRSAQALKMWKRLLVGLRIRERIEGYEIEGERDCVMEGMTRSFEEEDEGSDEGGGFLPDGNEQDIAQPTAARGFAPRGLADLSEKEGGGFFAELSEEDTRNQRDTHISTWQSRKLFLGNTEGDGGDDFLVNDADVDAEEALRETDLETSNRRSTDTKVNSPARTKAGPIQTSEQGGGFVPDSIDNRKLSPQAITQVDLPLEPTPRQEPPSPTHKAQRERSSLSPPFHSLDQAELKEAHLLQQLYDAGGMTPSHSQPSTPASPYAYQDDTTEPEPKPEPESEADAVDTIVAPQPSMHRAISHQETDEDEYREGSDDDSEGGSLLSNDPEDEDAEPEWLA